MINKYLEKLHKNKEISLEEKKAIRSIYNNLDNESDIDWDDLQEVTGINNLELIEEILDLMHDLGLITVDYQQNLIVKLEVQKWKI